MKYLSIPIVALVFTGFYFAEGWAEHAMVLAGWMLVGAILLPFIGRELGRIGDEAEHGGQ